jgi:sulfate adenylyltransferase
VTVLEDSLAHPTGVEPADGPGPVVWAPDPRQLDDLELLLGGGYAPLDRYLDEAAAAQVARTGRLPDGRPCLLPLSLLLPAPVAANVTPGSRLVLEDQEGVPLAEVTVSSRWRDQAGERAGGSVRALAAPAHGTFRSRRQPAAQVRAAAGAGPVLGVTVDTPLTTEQVERVRAEAADRGARVRLLVLVGAGSSRLVGADALVRVTLLAAGRLPGAEVVPVPLPDHDEVDPARRAALVAQVAAAYGADETIVLDPPPGAGVDRLAALLDAGAELPAGLFTADVEAELRAAHPPLHQRGVTLLLTGLSGSGKSTVARGVYEVLLERGRSVTLLDGDVVRRLLSAGLTFSREDRDLNVRRIGYVAAEVARHGGVAVCAPIAPFAATRAAVREMAESTGTFVLVHVATPLEECERRDRKGLYAKARAGKIPAFTGVSDPYEEPTDADLVVDTTGMDIDEAVRRVVALLEARGLLRPAGTSPAQARA